MDFVFFINVIASCKKFIVILMVLQILGRYWIAFFCATIKTNIINRSSRRKRGMASNPLFIIPDFFCIFPMNFAMATLGLKEIPFGR